MKELSIEEKAKRYDEASKIAKKNYISAQDLCEGSKIGIECFKNTLEKIFPELKENEDDRIRKELTEFLKNASGGFLDSTIQCKTFSKWVAWLEKQDDYKNKINSYLVERQGKQEPVWNEKDIFKVQRICKYLNEAKKYYADFTEVRECIDWLKSLEDRYTWKPSNEQIDENTLIECARQEFFEECKKKGLDITE